MTPEEMVETLNMYIQKARDDVSEAKSRYSRQNKSANNISQVDANDRSDIIQNRSEFNAIKTEMDKSADWDKTLNGKS